MLALIVVLLTVERLLPPLPFFPPNFKLGLSNIVVMFAIFFIGTKEAFTLGTLKGFFNFLLRGPIGGATSLAGGLLSIAIIVIIKKISRGKASLVSLSIFGAIFHNLGQFLVITATLGSLDLFMWYLPILLVAGVVFGILIGIATGAIVPMFKRIYTS